MKCYYHRDIDAVAVCTGCGKGLCQRCAVDVGGIVHCRECSTTSAARRAARGGPTNPLAIVSVALAVLGGLGCVCGGVGGILFGVPASITGWIAREQILQAEQEQRGRQLATIGLGLGIAEVLLGITVIALLLARL